LKIVDGGIVITIKRNCPDSAIIIIIGKNIMEIVLCLCLPCRAVRVYPYPRVTRTRTRGYGYG